MRGVVVGFCFRCNNVDDLCACSLTRASSISSSSELVSRSRATYWHRNRHHHNRCCRLADGHSRKLLQIKSQSHKILHLTRGPFCPCLPPPPFLHFPDDLSPPRPPLPSFCTSSRSPVPLFSNSRGASIIVARTQLGKLVRVTVWHALCLPTP